MIKDDKGFTLLEVFASMTILSIILITFFSVFSQGLLFSSKNEEKVASINLARETLLAFQQIAEENNERPNEHLIEPSFFSTTNVTTLNLSTNPYVALELFNQQEGPYYFMLNQARYYPEIRNVTATSQNSNTIQHYHLYSIHIAIYDSDDVNVRNKLSETYGFIRMENDS